jgi:hypothetical protein
LHAQLDSEAAASANVTKMLSDVEAFIRRFVVYPSVHALVAHVLWIAHTHLMDVWESTPRIAFLSPERESGKTRALEVTELLVPRPVMSVNATSAYLFRKVSAPEGTPTILYDEADTVFGPKARDNEDVRGMLNAGHRRGATAGRCVVRGKVVETEELPAYCAVALAGIGDLPDTILSRAIVVRMRRRTKGETIKAYRRRVYKNEGHALCDELAAWASRVKARFTNTYPEMPNGVEDRAADAWEPLLAVAEAAGGEWPRRAREAAVALVKEAKESTPSLGVKLLADVLAVFNDARADRLATHTILDKLCAMEESPWGDLRGKPLDARRLAQMLGSYRIKPEVRRDGEKTYRGYARADLEDAWSRYLDPLPAPPPEPVTPVTGVTSGLDGRHVGHNGEGGVTDVAGVTHLPGMTADAGEERF